MILKRIESLCKSRGITISKLEKECGIGNGTIARWNKSFPRTDNLKKVADFLEISIECLVEEKEDKKEKAADQEKEVREDGDNDTSVFRNNFSNQYKHL